jgi:hypothetical protein
VNLFELDPTLMLYEVQERLIAFDATLPNHSISAICKKLRQLKLTRKVLEILRH